MADEDTTQTATEEPQTATEEPQATSAPSADAPDLTAAEMAGWAGFKLDEMGGASVGKVEGVYVDEQSGKPEWLLARMGRFGHHCLVPARDAVGGAGHVWVPYGRDMIRRAPKVEANSPIDRDRELELLTYYGVGSTDVGRGAELVSRAAETITARPA